MKNSAVIGIVYFGCLMPFFSACQEDSLYHENDVKNEYLTNWIKQFGLIDQNHTWNVATAVEAQVSPSSFGKDVTVYIYTDNPLSGGKLIGKATEDTNLILDVLQGSKNVYVQVRNDAGCCFKSSYYNISAGKVVINSPVFSRGIENVELGETKSFAQGVTITEVREGYNSSNPYTFEEAVAKNDVNYLFCTAISTYNDGSKDYIKFTFKNIYNEEVIGMTSNFYYFGGVTGYTSIGFTETQLADPLVSNITSNLRNMNKRLITAPSPAVTYQKINGIETSRTASTKIKDLVPLFGTGGYFEESRNPTCLEAYHDYFNPDVTFTVSGPLTLDYMYGATAHTNAFGYYYWQDGEDPTKVTRYILMPDALPHHNISIKESGEEGAGSYLSDGMELSGIMLHGNAEESTKELVGTSFKVPYFDENGVASYSFPNGTHVAFFLIVNGCTVGSSNPTSIENSWLGNTNLSLRSHNLAWGRSFSGYKADNSDADSSQGEIDAITFLYGSQFYLGFEDRGGDKDMNDVVFFVNGNAVPEEPYIKISTDPSDDPNEWILACEDLGSTDDYDFNDIVFSVSHVAGETSATITPLAAGGVLHAELYYEGSPINSTAYDSEIHYLLCGEHYEESCPMLNTTKGQSLLIGTPITISVPQIFNITTYVYLFSIKVDGRDESYEISMPDPGQAPQIICLPGSWRWPTERVDIRSAYPDFRNWTSSSSNLGWLETNFNSSLLIDR